MLAALLVFSSVLSTKVGSFICKLSVFTVKTMKPRPTWLVVSFVNCVHRESNETQAHMVGRFICKLFVFTVKAVRHRATWLVVSSVNCLCSP